MKRFSLAVFLLSSLSLLSCSDVNDAEEVAIDPALSLQELESRLLNSMSMDMQFQITVSGAGDMSAAGRLQRLGGDQYSISAEGVFSGTPVAMSLVTQDGNVRVSNGKTENTFETPVELTPSLLLGLTRMGILHNLFLLTNPALPDHSAGGVADWVQTFDHHWVLSADTENNHPAIGFGITVNGTETATATLEINAAGLPVRRMQVVNFEGVEAPMRVVEEYTFVSFE